MKENVVLTCCCGSGSLRTNKSVLAVVVDVAADDDGAFGDEVFLELFPFN